MQAKNTIENAFQVLPLLEKHRVQHVTLVTSEYHMPRSRLLFELVLAGTGISLAFAEVTTWMESIVKLYVACQPGVTKLGKALPEEISGPGMVSADQHLM